MLSARFTLPPNPEVTTRADTRNIEPMEGLMFLLLAAAAFAPTQPAFDLANPVPVAIAREEAAPRVALPPRGMDTRAIAVDAPEVEMALLDPKVGPMLRIGALDGRHNAAPKLAHIAVGWLF